MDAESAIRGMVDRETAAWDRQDAATLVELFHPDMVWPWPPDEHGHDPITWILPMGRFDAERWRASWQELFDTHELVRNEREIRKIEVSEEGDGAFAVVDIDTVWRDPSGNDSRWKGRVCKVYSKVGGEWKMTMHTGVLEYR